jgi:DNA-binding XRE family transcriptional regulator
MKLNRLKLRYQDYNFNQESLATLLGISRTSVNDKITGKTSFRDDEKVTLVKVLEIPNEDMYMYFFPELVEVRTR